MELTFRRSHVPGQHHWPWKLHIKLTMHPAHVALLDSFGLGSHVLPCSLAVVIHLRDVLHGTDVFAPTLPSMIEAEGEVRRAVECVPGLIRYLHTFEDDDVSHVVDPEVTVTDEEMLAGRPNVMITGPSMSDVASRSVDPGYYPDPMYPGSRTRRRWWDGWIWTNRTDPEPPPGDEGESAETLRGLPAPAVRT